MIDLSALMLTVFYAAFGILLMIVSNIVIDCFIPGDFAEEIKRGNTAAGIFVFGIFVGLSLVISGAVH